MTELKGLIPYTAAYIISFLMAGAGLHLPSGLLLICAAVFIYVKEYKITHRRLNLRGLFALGLTGGEGVSCFQLSRLQHDWTVVTWICFYLGFAVFYAVCGFVMNERKMPAAAETEYRDISVQAAELKYLKLSIAILLVISYAAFAFEVWKLRYIPFLVTDTPHAYSFFHVKGVHYFTTAAVLIPSLAMLYLQRKKKPDITVLLGLILPLILTILLVSRFQFLFAVILAVFIAAESGRRYKPWQAVLIAVFMTAVYIMITVARAHSVQYLNGIFEMRNPSMPIFITQPYIYIANNYDNFNIMTEKLVRHSMGLKLLYPFVTLTGLKFLIPIPSDFPLFVTKTELTTVTVLYDAYYDFGIAGVALFSGVLGMISGMVSVWIRENRNPFSALIYVQLSFYLLFSFFTTWFSNPATWFYLGISVILYLFYEFMLRRNQI